VAQGLGPGPTAPATPPWYSQSSSCSRAYLVAAARAAAISLVLLGILALVVWM